jgi:hypothetical protein
MLSLLLGIVALPCTALAEPPAPASNVTVEDRENDAGDGLVVKWTLSPDDTPDAKPRKVLRYEVLRMDVTPDQDKPRLKSQDVPSAEAEPKGNAPVAPDFSKVGEQTYQKGMFVDAGVKYGNQYRYQVVCIGVGDSRSEPALSLEAASAERQWFNTRRSWFAVILIGVCGAVVYFIEVARSGRDLKIRKIAGLDAVDDAVGRATEMGRPVLFVPGITDINEIQTVAGLTVLSRVARQTAEYGAELMVPTSRSLVMAAARESVSSSYTAAGRPDSYREEDIYYITDEQFGYVAGVTGTMVREKPAACFYMGSFFAESLFLAETGNSIGAIQLAGTAEPAQLPFFVAACDYTLIGEEFFAASAYLSGEPHQLGSLKGQDLGKLVGALILIVGCFLATAASLQGLAAGKEGNVFASSAAYVRENILGEKGFRP